MTRRELHEKISETFEPKPTLPPAHITDVTPTGAWYADIPHLNPLMYWKCLNYDTHETANAMLLEAMPEPSLFLESSSGERKYWGCVPDIANDLINAFGYDRKIAIVDAYAKWKGIS